MDISLRELWHFKWSQWKADKRTPVLWAIEILLAVGIGAAIAIYLDPEWNVVPFPWNIIAFLILVGAAIGVHRRTKPFRIAKKIVKKRMSA